MYIQITNRCNMTCAHCCFDCKKTGQDMSLKTFRAALKLAIDNSEIITIGGGEPTLHKQFAQFMFEAMAANAIAETGCKIFIVTNGSVKRRALMLAELSRDGCLDAKLSQDQFHDEISQEVIDAFKAIGGIWSTGNDTKGPLRVGRAATELAEDDCRGVDCACSDVFVHPSGKIYQCGCLDSVCIGNTTDGYIRFSGECCHSKYFEEELNAPYNEDNKEAIAKYN